MADTLRNIGAQMANVMFNLAQRPGDALTSEVAAVMAELRKQWDAAVRATPSSPSTAPGKYHVKDHVVREVVNRLLDTAREFHAHGSLREHLARELEPLLVASSPAEVDDEGLRLLPRHVFKSDEFYEEYLGAVTGWYPITNSLEFGGIKKTDEESLPPLPEPRAIRAGHGFPKVYALAYTAEQYRQGQRDAVAADRARRGEKS